MTRLSSEQRVTIARPVGEVFAYMQDLAREPEWQDSIVEARQLTAGPVGVGTRRQYVSVSLGRRIESTYEVTAFVPERQVTYETTAESRPWTRWHIVYEAAGGATHVVMRVDADVGGFVGLMPRALLATTARRELRLVLGKLKQRLES